MRERISKPVPVQVYLAPTERERLERLAEQLETTKSEALRRGILALERELTDPAAHPALRLIGLAGKARPSDDAYDVAREHDRALANDEERTWQREP